MVTAPRFRKTWISLALLATAAGFFLPAASRASAGEGIAEIRVERHDPSFYTRLSPDDAGAKIDPNVLRQAYRGKLFCIPDGGKKEGAFHGYLWVVTILHAAGGTALALIFLGHRFKSFFSFLVSRPEKG